MNLIIKNIILLFCFCLLAITIKSQIPPGYYDDIVGLEDEELRESLHNIIKNHDPRTYNQIWNDFYYTDRKPNGKVWCIYTDIPYPGEPVFEFTFFDDQQGTGGAAEEGLVYNREHSFPKSWWGGGTSSSDTMYTDLFHIIPADAWINTNRSNLPYGEVCEPELTTSNGSKKGPNCYDFESAYTGTVFEPIDAYKGDLARHYFYMLTRYMNRIESWSAYENTDMLEGSGFAPWAYDMLLKWHISDPVSPKEIDRNNAIYERQGNRNPFIDHPDLACKIWGGDCTFAPSVIYARIHPEQPEAFDEVDVEAYIYDDGQVMEAYLQWGYAPDDLHNEIEMTMTEDYIFFTTNPIPQQDHQANIYYSISAVDDDDNLSQSSVYNYKIGNPIGGGLEDFNKSNATGSTYIDDSFVGNNDRTWSYYHARSEQSYPIDGKGLMFRDPLQSRIFSETVPHGIQDFSVKMRKAFSNEEPRQIELFVNGEKKGESEIFGNFFGDCDSIHVFEVNNINILGDITIELRLKNPNSENYNQIVIDDIFWTEYAPRIIVQKDKFGCFPNTPLDEYSEVKSYNVIGRFLDDMIIIESQAPFEISSDGENFSYFTFFEQNEEFQMNTVYLRFKPTENIYYESNITHYSEDIIEIFEVCGYGGSVSSENITNYNYKEPVFGYNNGRISINWSEIPTTDFHVSIYNINGKELLSQSYPPGEKTYIPIKTNSPLIIVAVTYNKKRFTAKLLTL
ncbi:MAG: endonuclease [Bacteroidales bacterium]